MVSSLPTISFIISSVVRPFASFVAIHLPSRIMVTSSDIRSISAILWEIYIIPQPWSRSIFIILKRCSTSSSVNEEVGSSKTITFELYETAFAISTICRWDTGIRLITVFGSTFISSLSKTSFVALYIFFSLVIGTPLATFGKRPSHILSITLRFKA